MLNKHHSIQVFTYHLLWCYYTWIWNIISLAAMWENVPSDIKSQRRLESACSSAQSDQILCYPHEETLHPWLSKMRLVKILIRLRDCASWSGSSLGAFIQRYVFDVVAHFIITKTRLHSFDPLKPHFYTVKLGFTGVYIIFLISAQKHRLWYSLEPPRWGGSNEYLQSMFWAEIWKISEFFIWFFFNFWR